MKVPILFFLMSLVIAARAAAGIFYDPAIDAIKVRDFPEVFPCSPSQLLRADRLGGWNKIAYDKTTHVYTVNCDLIIGRNDGGDTVFRLGSPMAPDETLFVNGDIYLSPWWEKGKNSSIAWYRVPTEERKTIRLVLGAADNAAIAPTLRTGGSLKVGFQKDSASVPRHGGAVFAYNTRLIAGDTHDFDNADGCAFGNCRFTGGRYAVYQLSEGYQTQNSVEDCVFENSPVGLMKCGGKLSLKRCRFTNLGEAIVDDRPNTELLLRDCVFSDNQRDWILRRGLGLELVDCETSPKAQPNVYKARSEYGRPNYPKSIAKRHVTVTVTNAEGKPAPGAIIRVKADQPDSGTPENMSWRTDPDGRSPAILLAESVVRATDTDSPTVTLFSYSISAEKDGEIGSRERVVPRAGNKFISVVIKKQRPSDD